MLCFRLLSGIVFGLEVVPTRGLYFVLYIGIIEIMFASQEFMEENYE